MATATSARANKFAGVCTNCGARVAAGAGVLGGKVAGKWTVKHGSCGGNAAPAKKITTTTTVKDGWKVVTTRSNVTGKATTSTSFVGNVGRGATFGRSECPTGGDCSSFGFHCDACDC